MCTVRLRGSGSGSASAASARYEAAAASRKTWSPAMPRRRSQWPARAEHTRAASPRGATAACPAHRGMCLLRGKNDRRAARQLSPTHTLHVRPIPDPCNVCQASCTPRWGTAAHLMVRRQRWWAASSYDQSVFVKLVESDSVSITLQHSGTAVDLRFDRCVTRLVLIQARYNAQR